MENPNLKKQILHEAFTDILDKAKVPARYHLKVIEALHKRIDEHKKDIESHRQHMAAHGSLIQSAVQHNMAHERQLAAWDSKVQAVISRDWTGVQGLPGNDGADGISPAVEDIVTAVLSRIPLPKDGEKGDKGKDANEDKIIVRLIEKIIKDKPLDISHIRNAQGFMKDGIKYKFEELMKGGGSASGSTTAVWSEAVSGSGTSWTLAHTPATGTLRLYANGQRLTVTVDYTLSGATITTLTSWVSGTVLADYSY